MAKVVKKKFKVYSGEKPRERGQPLRTLTRTVIRNFTLNNKISVFRLERRLYDQIKEKKGTKLIAKSDCKNASTPISLCSFNKNQPRVSRIKTNTLQYSSHLVVSHQQRHSDMHRWNYHILFLFLFFFSNLYV
jgi:hypothetical protein